jgi:lambda repressor-like predicted transcriptional regulator
MVDEMTPPHPETIKASIRIKYGSVRAFERAMALPAYSVRDVLRGRAVKATAVAISGAVDKTLEQLFPGRFDDAPLPKRDSTSQKRDSHRQNVEAR